MTRALIPMLAALVAVLFAASLLIGPAALGLAESLTALFRGEGGPVVLVMQEIRLPRAILGLLVGAVLGLSEGTIAWRMSEVKKRLKAMAQKEAAR